MARTVHCPAAHASAGIAINSLSSFPCQLLMELSCSRWKCWRQGWIRRCSTSRNWRRTCPHCTSEVRAIRTGWARVATATGTTTTIITTTAPTRPRRFTRPVSRQPPSCRPHSLWPPNPIHLLAPPHHPTSPSLTVRHSLFFLFCSPHYLSFLKLGAMWVKAEWRTTPNCWIPKETHWNVWQQLSESGAGCHRRRL